MSSAETFTVVDFGRRGYKILIILYDQLGVGLHTSARSLLAQSYCFRSPKDHVYDLAESEISGNQQRAKIIQNIQLGLSPIIIKNVSDLLPTKPLCEIAVKYGYLVDIIGPIDGSSIKTREDLFKDFELCYELEIPQLRQYPPIPKSVVKLDDTLIKEFIQREYMTCLKKNVKEVAQKNTNQEVSEVSNEPLMSNYEKEAFQAFTKSMQEDINRKFEENKQMIIKTMEAFFKDIKTFKEEQSKTLSNNVEDTDRKLETVNGAIMQKMEGLFRSMNSFNENQIGSLSEHAEEQRMAFMKTSSDYMNIRFGEYDQTMREEMENVLTETKVYSDTQIGILSERFDLKSPLEDMKNTLSENKNTLMKQMEDVKETLTTLAKSQDDINRRLNENDNAITKKMEDLLTEIKTYNKKQEDILSKRVDKQLTAFMKSSQDDMNKRINKSDNTVTKKMEDVLTEIKAHNEKQEDILSKRVDKQITAFMKLSQDDMNKRINKSDNTVTKKMEDVLTEIKAHNEKQEDILSKRVDKQITAFMKLSQDDINKRISESDKTVTKKIEAIVKEMKTNNENQMQMLKSMEQKFTTNTMSSNTIQFANDKAVDEKAKKFIEKYPNKTGDSPVAIKHEPQTQKALPQEIQLDNNEHGQIISYIKQGFKVMILMRGLPGSGKTYLANKILKDSLANVNPSEFIFDPLEQFMRNGRFKDGDSNAAHTMNKRKCFEAVTRGVSPVIVDNTNLQIEDMRVYCLMAIENGYMIETIEVNTAWASNAATLAKKNTLRLDKKQIQMLQDCYQRNVSSRYLLKELGVNHKQSLPQFRTYPPYFTPQDSTSVVVKKPAVVIQDYVHKFDMKYGEKADQTLINVSDTKETISASKEIKNENEEVINDMRKQIAEQNGIIQHLLKFRPMVQMNQNIPANVSMQQNKPQDVSEYNKGQQNINDQSICRDRQDFAPYSTNQPWYKNPNAGKMTGNYQTSSEGFWGFKEDNVRGNPDKSKDWEFK